MNVHPLLFCTGFAALLCLSPCAQASITFQFSNTSIYATNWADSAGGSEQRLYWGVIVDRDGDGLAVNYSVTGLNFGVFDRFGRTVGQSLIDGAGNTTDDVLFVSPVLMVPVSAGQVGRDGSELGVNRITSIANIPFLPGTDVGDPFYLVWFDHSGAVGTMPVGVPVVGEKFGIFGDPSFTMPTDGMTSQFLTPFVGPDPLRPMTHAFVPEPSVSALGMLGLSGLLRRRRS